LAGAIPCRPFSLGLPRAPARALSRDDGHRDPRAGCGRPPPRPFPHAPARLRLDPGPRHARAGGADLPELVGREEAPFASCCFAARLRACRAAMTDGREQILGSIRKSLKRGPVTAARAAELREKLRVHARNIIPQRADGLDAAGQVALFVRMAE